MRAKKMEEDAKFPICVLKVNIGCCKSCPEAVTKLLLATQGVKAVKTEADKCLVTVTGTTPPQKLIKQIAKIKRKAIVVSYKDPTKEEKKKDSGKEEEEKKESGKTKEEHNHHHHHHHSSGHTCGDNVVPPQQQQQEENKPYPCPEHTAPIFRVPPAAAHPEPPFPQRTQFTRDMHHYPPQQENCRDPHCRHHHQNNPNPDPDHTTPIFRVPPQPHPKPPFPQRTQFTKDIQLPHSQFSPPLQPHLDPHYPPSRRPYTGMPVPSSNFSPPLQPYLDSHYPPSPPLQPYLDAHYPPSRQPPSGMHVPSSNLPPSWRPYNAMPPPLHFNSHYPPQMRPPPNSYYNHHSGGDPYCTRPRPPPSYGGVGPRSRRPYYRDSDSDSDDEYTSFSGCNIL